MIPLPLVTAEALRGTLADMTQLGFLVGALHVANCGGGSAQAFRWPRTGGPFLGVTGVYGVLDSLRTLAQDAARPRRWCSPAQHVAR
jgi:hypothetical protein